MRSAGQAREGFETADVSRPDSAVLEITAGLPSDCEMAFMGRLLPVVSANFTGGLGGVSGNALQLNGLWLPDLGSNQGPAD
jgi:hypothetical protein